MPSRMRLGHLVFEAISTGVVRSRTSLRRAEAPILEALACLATTESRSDHGICRQSRAE